VSLLLSLLAASASGVLYGLAFPPARLQWLAWVALVPLLVAVRRGTLPAALITAWVFTIVSSYVTGSWFPRVVSDYFGQGPVVGLAAFFAISTLMGGPGVLGFTAAYRWVARRARPSEPLLAAAAWVAGELVRARLLTGNPWILLGYSQFGVAPVVQIADVTGIYGVSFVLAASTRARRALVSARFQRRITPRGESGLALPRSASRSLWRTARCGSATRRRWPTRRRSGSCRRTSISARSGARSCAAATWSCTAD
jgi:apolipoprotein N-acyltransferase